MLPAVALVPGFFGFDHRESRTYFADRFIAGLRAGLELTSGADFGDDDFFALIDRIAARLAESIKQDAAISPSPEAQAQASSG